jgi:FkbM family methyltransferase
MLLPRLAAGETVCGQRLWLYGAGNLGRLAAEFLEFIQKTPIVIFDSSTMVRAPRGRNPPVEVAVAVITSPYVPIERELSANGYRDVVPFYDFAYAFRNKHPLGENGWTAGPLTADDQARVGAVWTRWDDDVSRAHHLQFIAWRVLREEWTFDNAPVSNEDRYFIPEVVSVLHDHEVFLDGGAYHGDVSVRFLEIVGGADRIVMVEPDGSARARIPQTGPDIKAIDYALADYNGVGYFRHGFGYASRLGNASNGSPKDVVRMEILDVAPTFVKLHLEGGELAALRGAKRKLQTHRPIVAATVYHSDDGIWRTADWLMNTLEDYRFYFRNHCWCGAGAVLYAIPNERGK